MGALRLSTDLVLVLLRQLRYLVLVQVDRALIPEVEVALLGEGMALHGAHQFPSILARTERHGCFILVPTMLEV
jgi:hypothetical protein